METHLQEWLHLLLRWIHFIVGVAWIGASFYFNWLENRLDRRAPSPGVAGDLWAIHGGGFYYLQKFEAAPAELPRELHWFKWEAYTTWLSGVALLIVVYYLSAEAFLLKPDAAVQLSTWQGITVGVGALLAAWFAYDALCRSPLRRMPLVLAAVIFAGLTVLAWALAEVLSARAAYIHTGAAIGTIMVGNVFCVIIPAQKAMLAALTAGRAVDPARAATALLRSRHNNYLTLPALFAMLSIHFPATYAHAWNWAVLASIGAAGVLARHYFNVRHRQRSAAWLLVAGLAILVVTALVTAPRPPVTVKSAATVNTVATTAPGIADITVIVQNRCAACHARAPTMAGFIAPPAGVILESAQDIHRHAARVFATVTTRSMPVGNLTAMPEAERDAIAAWYSARTTVDSTVAPTVDSTVNTTVENTVNTVETKP